MAEVRTTEEILKDCFEEVGKKYGYDRVGAEFVAYRDFKVKWTRSYRWADFQVSDYLMNASEQVLTDLAETMFSRISGAEPKPYSPEMNGYITSNEFRDEKQQIYIRRSRNITRSPEGKEKNLTESLQRLKKLGLVEEDFNPYLTWTRAELQSTIGYCSTLMNTVVISSAFDSKFVPDEALDYALYHECLIIRQGRANFGLGEEFDLDAEEKKFPDWQEMEGWIRRMGLHF